MRFVRAYRLVEAVLVLLFFAQSVRSLVGTLLTLVNTSLASGQFDLLTVNSHLLLVAAIALPWFTPRTRTLLPRTLMVSAIVTALGRLVMSLDTVLSNLLATIAHVTPSGPQFATLLNISASVLVVGSGSVYMASLVRANWRMWANAIVGALLADQALRVFDSYDVSLKPVFAAISIGAQVFHIRWFILQVVLSILLIVLSTFARGSARSEPYEPAVLTVWGSLGLAGVLALEFLVLGLPNAMSRWASIPYATIIPWATFVTSLSLVPAVRGAVSRMFNLIDERMRGWVWLLVLFLAIVVGNRIGATAGVGALLISHFMVLQTLWWIPFRPDQQEVEQVGPSLSIGLFIFVLIVYAYHFAFVDDAGFQWLRDQGFLLIIVAVGLVGLPRLLWREDDPLAMDAVGPNGLATIVVISATVFAFVLNAYGMSVPTVTADATLRIASYNINQGVDETGRYQLDQIAQTIEASLADIIVIQEADTGRPSSFGTDQIEYLARRLRMYQTYQSLGDRLYGLAILSRWPILERTSTSFESGSHHVGIILAVVSNPLTGQSLTVIGAQMFFEDGDDQHNQIVALQGLIGNSSPAILAADLGATPDAPIYQQIAAFGFLDPDTSLGIEGGFTYPSSNPTVRHDYIWLRGLIPLDSRQVQSSASDHRLVVVEVGWP